MLKRQRIMLALLDSFINGLSRTELIKALSVLATQNEIAEDPGFYDFISTRDVIHSFTASHDIDKLIEHGYIKSCNGQTISTNNEQIAPEDFSNENKHSTAIKRTLYWIRSNKSSNPAITHKSKSTDKNGHFLYTAGYEGYSIESYIQLLMKHNIQYIIDVRKNPISRKYGFSKRALIDVCHAVGLEYIHKPVFGINSEDRKVLQTKEDYYLLIQEYAETMLPLLQQEIQETSSIVNNHSCVLLCYEADPDTCHRKPLALSISNETGQEVMHL